MEVCRTGLAAGRPPSLAASMQATFIWVLIQSPARKRLSRLVQALGRSAQEPGFWMKMASS
ncbi:hypothetical protein NS14008_01660 [Nocardia seriolae]|nr:hypothetical protein NS14008_01660 [Nocardia seriolae]